MEEEEAPSPLTTSLPPIPKKLTSEKFDSIIVNTTDDVTENDSESVSHNVPIILQSQTISP